MEQEKLDDMTTKHELLRRNIEVGVTVTSKHTSNEASKKAAESLIVSSLERLSEKLKDL